MKEITQVKKIIGLYKSKYLSLSPVSLVSSAYLSSFLSHLNSTYIISLLCPNFPNILAIYILMNLTKVLLSSESQVKKKSRESQKKKEKT